MRWSIFVAVFIIGVCTGVLSADTTNEDCSITDPQLEHKYLSALSSYTKCYWKFILPIIDVKYEEIEEPLNISTISEILTFMQYYVKLGPDCNKIIDELGLACIPLEGRIFMKVTERAHNEVVEYIFGNNSQRTIDFIESGDFQCCIREKLDQCFTYQISAPDLSRIELQKKNCRLFNNGQTCITTLTPQKCPNASTYVSDIVKIIKPTICPPTTIPRQKREILLEGAKYGLLSFVSSKKRIVREIGGMGSKLPHIERRVKSMCADSTQLDESIANMKLCLRTKQMFVTRRDEFIRHIDTCSNETRIILRQCLPEKLKYFPDFFFDLVDSVVKLLYDDFKEITEGLAPCMSNLKKEKSQADYDKCLARVGQDFEETILESKQKFCEKFIKASDCFVKQLKDTCPVNNDLTKFEKDYMKAMERPCTSNNSPQDK